MAKQDINACNACGKVADHTLIGCERCKALFCNDCYCLVILGTYRADNGVMVIGNTMVNMCHPCKIKFLKELDDD